MIVEMLLSLYYNLFDLLMFFEIPKLPQTTLNYFNDFLEYLTAGAGVLANYSPLSYLLTLLGIVVAVDIGVNIYKFVLWILRKIPVASIS